MKKRFPRLGATRTKRGFLLWPKTLYLPDGHQRERRWLMLTAWKQRYTDSIQDDPPFPYRWRDQRWEK